MEGSWEKVRGTLEAERAVLLKRAGKVESNLRRERTPLSADWEEAATVLQNDEVLEALGTEGRERLEMIEAALQRIENGTYGECGVCGKAIAPGRLEAMPESGICVKCAEAREA